MHWMIMPFKRYFDFEGRSRRMEFWMFQLLNFAIAMILMFPFISSVFSGAMADPVAYAEDDSAAMVAAMSGIGTIGMAGLGLYGIYALVALIPSIAVTVRRLHDRDMSGWWYLGLIVASLIPLVGFLASIAFLVLMFMPGTPGPNRFGEDPKGESAAEVFE